jgi:hypothetical protein
MMVEEKVPSVIALAGRRIDREGTTSPRFPEERVRVVRRQVADLLVQEHAVALVSSAACGADLIGLEEAERLGLRRRIVLPFAPGQFRDKSVMDCPGDWVSAFDRVVATTSASGDLVVLDESPADSLRAFAAANRVIIREARHLASALSPGSPRRLIAVIVWEGQAREGSDATDMFRVAATEAGFELRMVHTVSLSF